MTAQPRYLPGYDQFDSEIPDIRFPDKGIVPRAAQAIVASEAWTDANPMLNLSSFVTTFVEPENREIMAQNATKNKTGAKC